MYVALHALCLDNYSRYYCDHSGRTESGVQSLLSFLRLPLILDNVL